MNVKEGIIFCIIGLLLMSGGGMGVDTFPRQNTVYEYTITTESTSDYDESSAQSISELSEDDRVLLRQAFEQSEDFLDDSRTTIERHEQIDTELDWSVVKIDGVAVLVTVSESTDTEAPEPYALSVLVILFGGMIFMVGCKAIYNIRWETGSDSSSSSIDIRDPY
jgi:hypothetical protein